MKNPALYIMASQRNGTLYIGVTAALSRRILQHKNAAQGFTGKYACNMLGYCEAHADMATAIVREKQIKAWRRAKKMALIEAANPQWLDLSATLID